MSCAGGNISLIVPCNAAAYTAIFAGIGFFRARRNRTDELSPRCERCGYSRIGNRSWFCPECGTEFAPITEAMRSDVRKVAVLAEQYLDGEASWRQCMDGMDAFASEMFDRFDEASELYDQIEHEPKVGGFGGISEEKNEERIAGLRRLVANLKGGTSA